MSVYTVRDKIPNFIVETKQDIQNYQNTMANSTEVHPLLNELASFRVLELVREWVGQYVDDDYKKELDYTTFTTNLCIAILMCVDNELKSNINDLEVNVILNDGLLSSSVKFINYNNSQKLIVLKDRIVANNKLVYGTKDVVLGELSKVETEMNNARRRATQAENEMFLGQYQDDPGAIDEVNYLKDEAIYAANEYQRLLKLKEYLRF